MDYLRTFKITCCENRALLEKIISGVSKKKSQTLSKEALGNKVHILEYTMSSYLQEQPKRQFCGFLPSEKTITGFPILLIETLLIPMA